jgi:3',5'-cyclic AMP phosphodiesterase CpdA
MRTIAHLSDLHFGRVDEALLEPLVASVSSVAPDVVVVSGDLTQRARSAQFRDAKAFLARLPAPQVVVPGNHDVPMFNVFDRFVRPLAKYRRHIETSLTPSYIDGELAVLGINTARSLVVKNGRVNTEQIAQLRRSLSALHDEVVKVVVTHHPFDTAEADPDDLVGRATLAMQMFAQCRVDLLLAGHMHLSHSDDTSRRYAMPGYEALVVSAGTATSTRGRGEVNSYNVLRLEKHRVEVQRMDWVPEAARFEPAAPRVFERSGHDWRPLHPTP